jgi:hypothetical protein
MNRLAYCVYFLFVVLCKSLFAQTQFIGDQINGVSSEDASYLKKLGLLAAFVADRGVFTNASGKVYGWSDMSGGGYRFIQNTAANQPAFNGAYTTNGFPSIIFENGGSERMTCHPIAPFFSGSQKAYTIITLICSQTNGINCMASTLGWSNATNLQASIIALRPNGNTFDTKAHASSWDTNSAIVQVAITSATPTNCFTYATLLNTGSAYSIMDNLRLGTVGTPSNNNRTLDTCTIGCLTRTNLNTANFWYGGIAAQWYFTNDLSGSTITNVLNKLNSIKRVY